MTDTICFIHIALTICILYKEHVIIPCRMTFPNCVKKDQIDANLSLEYFVNFYMFRGVSRPIIRRYNRCVQQLVLSVVQPGQQTVI